MLIKECYTMTDRALAREVGHRIDQLRLEQNISQKEVADHVGITIKTYRRIIDGGGKIETLISVLRVLGQLELVDSFIPESTFSPLELVKMRNKKRLRASRKTKNSMESETQQKELDW